MCMPRRILSHVRVMYYKLVQEGRAAKFAGVLYKGHFINTGPVAQALEPLYPDFRVLGSIVLNSSVGGINPRAVEVALTTGAKLVFFPTLDAQHHIGTSGKEGAGITVLTAEGNLSKEAKKVIEMSASAGVTICTGHLSVPEAVQVVRYAASVGAKRIMATHVSAPRIAMPVEVQRELAGLGALLEHSFVAITPTVEKPVPIQMIIEEIQSIGPAHCVLTTDFGQPENPGFVEGMYSFVESLLQAGFKRSDIRMMIVENPERLVG